METESCLLLLDTGYTSLIKTCNIKYIEIPDVLKNNMSAELRKHICTSNFTQETTTIEKYEQPQLLSISIVTH